MSTDVLSPAIECTALEVRYGSHLAVVDLSFTVHGGEVVVLLGPNGAGKTSTVECLEGYRRPTTGQARVLGLHPIDDHRALAPKVGIMLQRGGIYPMLGPRRALDLFASYYRDAEPTDELLDLIGLRSVARTPWRHLSGGEQQRLSLGLALVGRPTVVVLDEPTAGVDPEGRISIRRIIADLRSRGVAILLTTHELDEAEKLSDRIVIMKEGSAVMTGTLGELATRRGSSQMCFTSLPALDVGTLGRTLAATVIEDLPGAYIIDSPSTPRLTATLTAWLADRNLPISNLRHGTSLEEIYFEAIGSTTQESTT